MWQNIGVSMRPNELSENAEGAKYTFSSQTKHRCVGLYILVCIMLQYFVRAWVEVFFGNINCCIERFSSGHQVNEAVRMNIYEYIIYIYIYILLSSLRVSSMANLNC